jgi:hypothetical protein
MMQVVTPSWDPRVSERREERGVLVREEGEMGRGPFSRSGPEFAPGSFSSFSFLFPFSFLNLFEIFCN